MKRKKKRINNGDPFTELNISFDYVEAQQVADTGYGAALLYTIPGTHVVMPLPKRAHGWTNPSRLHWWTDRVAARSRRALQEAKDRAEADARRLRRETDKGEPCTERTHRN